MKITVRIRQVYGRDTIYPVCDKALLLAKLIGQKSFCDYQLRTIRELGFTIETEQQTIAA
jgi:hypothetical protein